MKIKLANDFFIEIDALNYTLKQAYVNEKGKTVEKICGYYGDVDGAVNKYIKLNQIQDKEIYDLKSYTDYIKECNAQAVNQITENIQEVHYGAKV